MVSTPGVGSIIQADWIAAVALLLNGTGGAGVWDYTDTGWESPTLSGGWTNALSFRQLGNKVYASGFVSNAAFTGGMTTIGTIPTDISPPTLHAVVVDAQDTGGVQTVLQVDTGGNIGILRGSTSAANIWFSTVTWLTD